MAGSCRIWRARVHSQEFAECPDILGRRPVLGDVFSWEDVYGGQVVSKSRRNCAYGADQIARRAICDSATRDSIAGSGGAI